jgi:Ca-activated chloride channel family protein
MVSFAEPARLWLLAAPAGAVALALLRHYLRLGQQRRLASPAVWARLMGGAPATGLLRMLLWCLAAAMVVLALARPQWGEVAGEESVRTRDLVIALDTSDSMLCPDLRPTRLARSLEELQRLLPQLEGNRVGVVVFAGDAYPLVPLTTDLHAVATFLDGVEAGMVGLPGSNLERAVRRATDLLPEQGEGRVVLLISDGENLQGSMETAADALTEAGAGILAVVAGTAAGGPIPIPGEDGRVRYKTGTSGQPVMTRAQPEVLASLAESMDGEVVELVSSGVADQLAATIEQLRTREVEINHKLLRVDRFPLFLGAGAALLALGFSVSPWRRTSAVLALLLLGLQPSTAQQAAGKPVVGQAASPVSMPPPAIPARLAPRVDSRAPAGLTEPELPEPAQLSWWLRLLPGDSRQLARKGADLWRQGEVEEAAAYFMGAYELDKSSPDRQYDLGTALAAGGALEAAIPIMHDAHSGGARSAAYNLGTASLQQEQAELAVVWLREALLVAPDDVEVKRNYELALRLLAKAQNDQQDQQSQEEQNPQQPTRPTPTPAAHSGGPTANPTPTPSTENAIYAALERAEAAARAEMQKPTPQPAKVEKDW